MAVGAHDLALRHFFEDALPAATFEHLADPKQLLADVGKSRTIGSVSPQSTQGWLLKKSIRYRVRASRIFRFEAAAWST